MTVGWWYFAGRRPAALIAPGALRNVPITSWSTVTVEAVTSASFSPDSRMVAFSSAKSGANELWTKPTAGGDPIQVTKSGFYNQYPVWSPNSDELAFFSSRGGNPGLWKVSFTGGQEVQLTSEVSRMARPLRWLKDQKLLLFDKGEIFSLDLSSGVRSQLTDMASASMSPRAVSVSTDGTKVAISIKEEGEWKLKSKRLSAGTFEDVATSKEQIDSIAFHPDAKQIYYTGSVDGTFQIFITAPGQNAVQLSNSSSDMAVQDVSSDGTRVLYNTLNETSDLWAITLGDGKNSVVANDVAEEYWADVSPDGKSIVYQVAAQADRPFRGVIYVKATAGGTAQQIAEEGFSPKWSNDGQWIEFMRRTATGRAIWKVRPTGADATKLVEGDLSSPGYISVPYLKTTANITSWANDGGSILYSAKAGGISNIWTVPADGGQSHVLTQNEDAQETFLGAVMSPDSQFVAFTSNMEVAPPKNTYRVWIAAADGSGARPIFESRSWLRLLGWAGRQLIVSQSSETKGTSQIPASTDLIALSLDGGGARKVATIANAYTHNFQLSPSGQIVAYATRSNDVCEIWSLPVSGGQARKLISESDPKVLFSSIAWSSDSRFLIYGKQTRTNVLSMLTN